MRRLSALPVLMMLAACSQEAPPAPAPPAGPPSVAVEVVRDPTAIPARFRGEWNAELSACGTGRSESRLTVAAREVRFYESTGAVKSVALPTADQLRATLRMTGEGETWDAVHDFRLSPDGATLTDAGGLIRHRCP